MERAVLMVVELAIDSVKLSHSRTAAQQVDEQNHHGYHQQQMDQASGNVQAETEKPQNQKHNENRPKHICSPSLVLRILEFCISAPSKRLLTAADRPTMTGPETMMLYRIAHNPPEFQR